MSDLAGSLIGAGVSAYGQHQANKANTKLAREQMKFQERMSSTAHQRQVKDLKAAGLNPVLSAGLSGSSSPSGQTAQMQNVAQGASTSAIQFMQGLKQIEKMDAEIQNTKADTANKTPEALLRDQASGFITKAIDTLKGDNEAFSAKSINKNVVKPAKWGYKKYVQPEISSAKKKFQSLKKSVTNKYQEYKNKFNKMFGN